MGRAKIKTQDGFKEYVKAIEAQAGYRRPLAFAIGLSHVAEDGKTRLDAYFPFPNFNQNHGSAAVMAHVLGHLSGTNTYVVGIEQLDDMLDLFKPFIGDGKRHGNIEMVTAFREMHDAIHDHLSPKVVVVTFIDQPEHDPGPQDVADAYLRLQLLSDRQVKPHGINLTGIFNALPIVAHTSEGPIAVDELPQRRFAALRDGAPLHVYSIDRFPPMADYVVPSGVRIADASRVRLGAHLGNGTTLMHEGFVNFNAGTLGKSMVEGRISAGVVVDDQTDIGGGASIMGTLSGGGKEVVKIGRGCLIGANAGTGISLGDLCVVEAGLYVTAGMPVMYNGREVKARDLSGKERLTFRRNGKTGTVEAIEKPNAVTLNPILHDNKSA